MSRSRARRGAEVDLSSAEIKGEAFILPVRIRGNADGEYDRAMPEEELSRYLGGRDEWRGSVPL